MEPAGQTDVSWPVPPPVPPPVVATAATTDRLDHTMWRARRPGLIVMVIGGAIGLAGSLAFLTAFGHLSNGPHATAPGSVTITTAPGKELVYEATDVAKIKASDITVTGPDGAPVNVQAASSSISLSDESYVGVATFDARSAGAYRVTVKAATGSLFTAGRDLAPLSLVMFGSGSFGTLLLVLGLWMVIRASRKVRPPVPRAAPTPYRGTPTHFPGFSAPPPPGGPAYPQPYPSPAAAPGAPAGQFYPPHPQPPPNPAPYPGPASYPNAAAYPNPVPYPNPPPYPNPSPFPGPAPAAQPYPQPPAAHDPAAVPPASYPPPTDTA